MRSDPWRPRLPGPETLHKNSGPNKFWNLDDVQLVGQPTQSGNRGWDADGSGADSGGSGTWDNTAAVRWRETPDGGSLYAWNSGRGDNAFFAHTPGTVTIAAGTLVLGKANGYQGPTTIQAGTLHIAVANNLGCPARRSILPAAYCNLRPMWTSAKITPFRFSTRVAYLIPEHIPALPLAPAGKAKAHLLNEVQAHSAYLVEILHFKVSYTLSKVPCGWNLPKCYSAVQSLTWTQVPCWIPTALAGGFCLGAATVQRLSGPGEVRGSLLVGQGGRT